MSGQAQAEQLIRERAADWSRRSDKWHAALGRERTWSWCGVAVPPVIFALASLTQVLGAPKPALITAVAGLFASMVALRAHFGKQRIETDKTELAWVTADRLREAYRGLLGQLSLGAELGQLLTESNILESHARFGVPEELETALENAAVMTPSRARPV